MKNIEKMKNIENTKHMHRKISYGVALCRYNKEKNNRVEILMIRKRYSYHFFNFVFGRYKTEDTKQLKYMISNMSFGEKIDIFGMNFENMWYRIWLNNPIKKYDIIDLYKDSRKKLSDSDRNKLFFQKKTKFEKNFMYDGGKRIKKLICESMDAELTWEIPGGGKNLDESNIDCAIREFREETGISENDFKILYNVKPIISSIVDGSILYQQCYYIAVENEGVRFEPKINFNKFIQISEIEQLKWVSVLEVDFLQLYKNEKYRLLNLMKNIVKKFKESQKIHHIKIEF